MEQFQFHPIPVLQVIPKYSKSCWANLGTLLKEPPELTLTIGSETRTTNMHKNMSKFPYPPHENLSGTIQEMKFVALIKEWFVIHRNTRFSLRFIVCSLCYWKFDPYHGCPVAGFAGNH